MGTSTESGGKRKGTGKEEKETRRLQGRGRDEIRKWKGELKRERI
jgi:hypothetical protein